MATSTHFVIYTLGRTGSSLLVSLLNRNPKIRCYGELFNPTNWSGPIHSRLLPIACRHPVLYIGLRTAFAGRAVIGFKLLYAQNRSPDNLLLTLAALNWKIVHLQRRNLFQRTVSAAMLRTTGIIHRRFPGPQKIERIAIEAALFEQVLLYTLHATQLENEALEKIPHLIIKYEDGLEQQVQWQPTADRVFSFLGVPSAPVCSSLQKTYHLPYEKMITNFADLVEIARKHNVAT